MRFTGKWSVSLLSKYGKPVSVHIVASLGYCGAACPARLVLSRTWCFPPAPVKVIKRHRLKRRAYSLNMVVATPIPYLCTSQSKTRLATNGKLYNSSSCCSRQEAAGECCSSSSRCRNEQASGQECIRTCLFSSCSCFLIGSLLCSLFHVRHHIM